ncbi:DNA replication/repair protein RecF [Prevotella sp. AGR2160]|uniref:DNA replication/repair protein RecF n=1 Tax=Prevotella sp. AGR2160 TaxID=1280674 RepID=UPI0004160896|nr:DNA replication and repair protein RecF [Prevotella sp. AGR2160]
MIIKHLSLINYKNIREATLDFSPKMNCFIGHNGVGKTNLLDALYYLSFCHSAFNPIDSQLITHGEDFMVLEGLYTSDDGNDEEHIYCGMKRGQKKHFKRNKKEYKRLSEHIGLIPVIFVSPSDNSLVDGGSEQRRKLMDRVISQYDPSYMDALANNNKALQQRNALLKQDDPDTQLLDIWEREMASSGEILYHKRTDFIQRLEPLFQQIYSQLSGGHEQVSLRYVSHGQRGPLLDIIQRDRFKDLAVGYSLHGVHRDDLEMLIDGFQMKREGSQGQTKTFVIALKLAQFDFLRQTVSKTTPLLLLDDIFDKLDAKRVEQIISLVSSDRYGQIFITDTNREHLDRILAASQTDYRLFEVEDGEAKLL